MTADMSRLRALEPLCWRAPSAHNTQPWRLTYHPRRVAVEWHPDDTLPAGDPTGRDLRLSLGAFVETCLVVAAGAGLRLRFVPDYSDPARRVGWLCPADRPYPTAFDAATVRDRATHRGRFRGGPAPEARAAADALARAAGGALRQVPARGLTGLLRAADRRLYADPATVAELRAWLRLTPAHPRYERDGLTDTCLQLSRVAALGLRAALAGYPVLRPLGLPRLLAAASHPAGTAGPDPADGPDAAADHPAGPGDGPDAAADHPAGPGGEVLALTGPPGLDAPGQVGFGRVLLRVWLTFTAAGLACHPLSQLLDAPATRAALATGLRVAPAQVLHVARVGLPATAPPRSPRRLPAAEQPRDRQPPAQV